MSIETSCTCRPSPPGSTHHCEGEQIAVCGDGGTGVCEGRCVPIDPTLSAVEYTAALLSAVVRRPVTVDDLERLPDEFTAITYKLLQSSDRDETVSFNLAGRRYSACVGLTEIAQEKLGQAVDALAKVPQPALA